jgi:hypothetical protein
VFEAVTVSGLASWEIHVTPERVDMECMASVRSPPSPLPMFALRSLFESDDSSSSERISFPTHGRVVVVVSPFHISL